jgi:sulfur carrier protein ThiS
VILLKIYIEKNHETKEINFSGTVKELLLKLNINHHTIMVVSNDKEVKLNDKLKDSDNIRLLDIVMGG